jgi:RNA polymerase sigma factor (TIGR02999 family)
MTNVTRIVSGLASGDRMAAAELLPLAYDELRLLAKARIAEETPSQTLQPTALLREAYLRLIGPADDIRWDTRGHFLAAAAEPMRQILVEAARKRRATMHGGGLNRHDATEIEIAAPEPHEELIALDEATGRSQRSVRKRRNW